MVRHLLSTCDLGNGDALDILREAERARKGQLSFQRAILGLCFQEESLRSAAALKAAIIRLGGGWLGFEGVRGTYLERGWEDLSDTAKSLVPYCDVLAVRGQGSLTALRGFPIPVINAGVGSEHSVAGLWLLYTLSRRFPLLKGLRVGVYGPSRYSQAVKAYYGMLSKFEVGFFEDPVVPGAGCGQEVISAIQKGGSTYCRRPVESFVGAIDFLLIADALGETGMPAEALRDLREAYQPVSETMIARLPQGAYWMYVMPRRTLAGGVTVPVSLDSHPQLINAAFLREMLFSTMGLLGYLLEPDR